MAHERGSKDKEKSTTRKVGGRKEKVADLPAEHSVYFGSTDPPFSRLPASRTASPSPPTSAQPQAPPREAQTSKTERPSLLAPSSPESLHFESVRSRGRAG
eukprot:m.403344 g.403344  ORF g.403344 m.403344 type:complete len:101 (-) comp16789_c1_seq8:743-1045(-)